MIMTDKLTAAKDWFFKKETKDPTVMIIYGRGVQLNFETENGTYKLFNKAKITIQELDYLPNDIEDAEKGK